MKPARAIVAGVATTTVLLAGSANQITMTDLKEAVYRLVLDAREIKETEKNSTKKHADKISKLEARIDDMQDELNLNFHLAVKKCDAKCNESNATDPIKEAEQKNAFSDEIVQTVKSQLPDFSKYATEKEIKAHNENIEVLGRDTEHKLNRIKDKINNLSDKIASFDLRLSKLEDASYGSAEPSTSNTKADKAINEFLGKPSLK